MKKIGFLLLLALSSVASAASFWEAGPGGQGLTVHAYRYYYDGTSTFVEVEFKEPIALTGCAPSVYVSGTNLTPKLAHWYAGAAFNAHNDYLLKTLMTAKETGRKVDVYWSNGYCNPNSGWMIFGIKMRDDVLQ